MKRKSIWKVNAGEALTEKKNYTMVSIKQEVEDEVAASVNHITITKETKEEFSIEDNAEDAPPTFEGVQATINELKEVNNSTTEDFRLIFINVNLSLEEEAAYTELLKEYKDDFAWTYKEMSGPDLKVVIHHLLVRHGV